MIKIKIKLEKIKNNIPEDFKFSLSSLANKTRFQISLLLRQKKSLSFTDIAKSIGKENSLTANHIKELELGGIIQNYIDSNSTSKQYSFYELTSYGKEFLDTIVSSYIDFYNMPKMGNQIPEDLIQTLKALQNKFRLSLSLLLKDTKEFSFNDIFVFGNKSKSAITHHLKKLELAGIIQNIYIKKSNSNQHSFYQITNYGRKIISELVLGYNNYFNREKKTKSNEISFSVGSGSWALPNEK